MDFNMLEMSNGTKYRALVEFNALVEMIDAALKAGGLITIPMGITKPGSPVVINPQHVVVISES